MSLGSVSRLSPEQWAGAVALVAGLGLPTEDLVLGRQEFWGISNGDEVVGVIAREVKGSEALVRSFAVVASARGRGIGTLLYRSLEAASRSDGTKRLVLLTETAEGFFLRQGFHRIARGSVSAAIQTTAEFTGLCPQSAICLAKGLG